MIVNCVAYHEGQKLGDVAVDDISEVLRFPGHFVWIGLHEPEEPMLRKIQEEFGLHDLAIEDAHRAHQRPKLEEYGNSLFVVLRTAQMHEGRIQFGETHVFVGSCFVVTVRHGASLSYAEVRTRLECHPHLLKKGPGYVLYAIMDFVVDKYFPIIDTLEEELQEIEEQVFGETFGRDTTARIYHLKRDLVALKRTVSPLIDVCNRLMRYQDSLISEDVRVYFRDVYDHVVRINEGIDTLRELLTTALEANLSLISVRQNDVMKQLAAWAAILAVPTAVAGIYGMNFEFMPELHSRWGYPAVMAFMIAACTGLYLWFKRSGWL